MPSLKVDFRKQLQEETGATVRKVMFLKKSEMTILVVRRYIENIQENKS